MKVALGPEGKLGAISKQLTEFDRGYVGMTYCPESMLETYFEAFDRVARRHGDQAVVEMVLGELADAEGDQVPRAESGATFGGDGGSGPGDALRLCRSHN